MRGSNIRKIFAAVVILILLTTLFFFSRSANRERKFTKAVSQFHFIAKTLEVYIREQNSFPTNLEEMLRNENVDLQVLAPVDDEHLEYFAPNFKAPLDKPNVENRFRKAVSKTPYFAKARLLLPSPANPSAKRTKNQANHASIRSRDHCEQPI